MRSGRVAAAAAAAILSMLALPATPSGATTYYEYWSYWHKAPGSTSWQYSSVGSSGYYLKSGTQVEGWRYALGTASPSDPKPRPTDVTYDQYCAGKNAANTYRVLLVVDYGTASSAPGGPVYSCYGFDDSVTGYRVLTQQHSERDSGGLICAIDSYPRSGCGETVSSPAPQKSTQHSTKPTHASRSAQPTTRAVAPAPTTTQSEPRRTTTSVQAATSPSASTASPSDPPSPDPTSTAPTLRPFTGASSDARSSSFPWGLAIGITGVVALGAGAVWMRRRSP